MKFLTWISVISSLLLFCSAAWASTPDYSIQTDIDGVLEIGDQDVGDFIFLRQPYIADTLDADSYTTINAQRHDKVEWGGSGTIEITAPNGQKEIVTPGGMYVFAQRGTYDYRSLGNSSRTGEFLIAEADTETVTIQAQSPTLDVDIGNSITINEAEKVVPVSVDVPVDVPPGSYPVTFIFNGQYKDVNRTVTFEVPEIRTWDITENTLDNVSNATSGGSKEIGEIIIRNTGNINFPITLSVDGNASSFLTFQSNQTLYKKTSSTFNIIQQVPTRQDNGLYKATLNIEGGDDEEVVVLYVNVTDFESPKINNISFSDEYVWHENEAVVVASDNVELERATIQINNKTFNMTRDKQTFYYTTVFNSTDKHNFTFCVYDHANNNACENLTKTFKKLDILDSVSVVEMPLRQTGRFSSNRVLNLSEEPPKPITIELQDFTSDEQGNDTAGFTIRLVDGNGEYHRFVGVGSKVNITRPGNIMLEIQSDFTTSFSGQLAVLTPDYMEDVNTISFRGGAREYEVPAPFTLDWTRTDIECDVVDTGEFSTSKIRCPIEFPIDTEPESIAVPMTVSELQLLRDNFNESLRTAEDRVVNYQVATVALIGMSGALLMSLVFLWKVYPTFRFRRTR